MNFPADNLYGMIDGPFSITRRCFLKDDVSNIILKSALDFHKKYKGKPKYSFNEFMDGHEASTLVSKYLDDGLLEHMKNLEKEKILDDTLILLVSDHGNHM